MPDYDALITESLAALEQRKKDRDTGQPSYSGLTEEDQQLVATRQAHGDTVIPEVAQPVSHKPVNKTKAEIAEIVNELQGIGTVNSDQSAAFGKAFATADTFAYNAGVGMTALTGIGGELRWRDDQDNLVLPHYKTSEELYGEDFGTLGFEERRQRVKRRRNMQINEYYGNIPEGIHGGTELAGSLLGYLADPTTLAPIGKSVKAAAGFGSGVVGADVALHQLADQGKINAGDVAIGMAVGAIAGVVIKAAGDAFMPWVKERIARGEPLEVKEVEKMLEGASDLPPDAADTFVNAINAKFNLTPEGHLEAAIATTNRALRGSADMDNMPADVAIFLQRQAAEGMLVAGRKLVAAMSNESRHSALTGTKFDGPLQIARMVDESFPEPMSKSIRKTKDPKRRAKKIAKAEHAFAAGRQVARALKNKPSPLSEAIVEVNAKRAQLEASDLAESFVESLPRNNLGAIDKSLVEDVGVGTFSKATGNTEADVIRAITFEDIPTDSRLGRKLWPYIDRMTDLSKPVTPELAEKWMHKQNLWRLTQRPTMRFEQLHGRNGKVFNEVLNRADEDMRHWTSKSVRDVDRAMESNGITKKSVEADQVGDVLRGTLKAGQVSKAVMNAAQTIRAKLNNAVKLAVRHGVLSVEDGRAMLANAVKNGYMPRIYNHVYLNTVRGKNHWVKVLAEHQWKPKELDNALESILGMSRQQATAIKSGFKKNGDFYVVDKEFATNLWRQRGKAIYANKSGHLEKGRNILLPDRVLKPFLLNDIHDVTGQYFQEVYKRIVSAKYFGPKYERMKPFIDAVKKNPNVTENDVTDLWQVAFTMGGDSQSNVVKSYMNLPSFQRELYSRITAFETFKLTFAQTLNIAQSTVNGNIMLANKVGIKGIGIYVKAIKDTLKKENREWATNIGASSETTIMEIAGESGNTMGKWSTAFLKGTGFIAVEKMQRQLAANMGRGYVEALQKMRVELMNKRGRRRLSNREMSKLRDTEEKMTEMGISLSEKTGKISVQDMNRAAQRFSNVVNFVNSPHKLPLATQSPHAKIFRQFKTFAFNQGAFVLDHVIKPMRKGNFRGAMALMGAGGVGMGPDAIRRWLKADDEEYTMTEKYLRGFTAIGGLGLMYDTLRQLEYGGGSVLEALAGPAAGDLLSGLEAGYKTGKKVVEGEGFDSAHIKKLALDLTVLPFEGDIKRMMENKKSPNYEQLYKQVYK